jgi:hypothetical protein
MPVPKIGETLKNGATLIARSDGDASGWSYILAHRAKPGVLPEYEEYITWLMNPEGNTEAGHYFFDFFQACDDLKERIKR